MQKNDKNINQANEIQKKTIKKTFNGQIRHSLKKVKDKFQCNQIVCQG